MGEGGGSWDWDAPCGMDAALWDPGVVLEKGGSWDGPQTRGAQGGPEVWRHLWWSPRPGVVPTYQGWSPRMVGMQGSTWDGPHVPADASQDFRRVLKSGGSQDCPQEGPGDLKTLLEPPGLSPRKEEPQAVPRSQDDPQDPRMVSKSVGWSLRPQDGS